MMPTYPDSLTLAEARALFFARSGLGEDGGYNARWVRVEAKPFPVFFPNTACRVEAAKLHDLHHIAMEYETDWAGEAEIAAWEIASGCGRHGWAWLLNLGAFTVGTAMFPGRLYRAFIRGRHAKNLYREGFPDAELPRKTVRWLRDFAGATKAVNVRGRDRLAFTIWCAIGIAYHAAWVAGGTAILWSIAARLL